MSLTTTNSHVTHVSLRHTAQSAEGPWASLWVPLLTICLWLVADNSFSHGTMQLCNTT